MCICIGALKFFYNCCCFRSNKEWGQRTRDEYMCDDNQYNISFDPHIHALEGSFNESLMQRQEPSAFITNSIWPIIDLLQS